MKEKLTLIIKIGIDALALYGLSFLAVPKLSREQIEEAEEYGGSDIEEWRKYEESDNLPSFDKGGHKERSIAHQPNHLRHWGKIVKGKFYGKK